MSDIVTLAPLPPPPPVGADAAQALPLHVNTSPVDIVPVFTSASSLFEDPESSYCVHAPACAKYP